MLKTWLSKEGRQSRTLVRSIAKATNAKIKPEDRQPALHYLFENLTDDATLALLTRLTFVYDTNIVADEDEKTFVYEGLVAQGKRIVPMLRKHLQDAPSLSWGLRILNQVCDKETAWQILSSLLEDFDPDYERDPTRKQQLLVHLAELDEPRVAAAILPFAEDHNETIRFITIDALVRRGSEDVARDPLVKHLLDGGEDSLRVRNRIAEGFAERDWTVKGYRGAVEEALPEDYELDSKGRVRRKKKGEVAR